MAGPYIINTGDKVKAVTITDVEVQAIIDDNLPGDCFGVEEGIEALIKSKQQDSQKVQVKVLSLDPFSMRLGLTTNPDWKNTV